MSAIRYTADLVTLNDEGIHARTFSTREIRWRWEQIHGLHKFKSSGWDGATARALILTEGGKLVLDNRMEGYDELVAEIWRRVDRRETRRKFSWWERHFFLGTPTI